MMDLIRKGWWLISSPEGLTALLSWGGIPAMACIVFAETGLLLGFFLPGDSMLFMAGFLSSPAGEKLTGQPLFSIVWLNVVLSIAAIVGDSVGYWIGHRAGPAIFNRPQSRLFRRDHLLAAHEFYEKYGGVTIILARFVPIVRTFAPAVAGAADMNYRQFVVFNIVGGIMWVMSMTLLGFYLGRFDWVQHNVEKAVLAVIFVSVAPAVYHWWQIRRKKKAAGLASNGARAS